MIYDIAFALNQGIVVALLTAMNSVASNTATPEKIRFNITVPPQEVTFFEEKITAVFPNPKFTWRVYPFTPPQFMADYIHAKFEPMTATQRLARYMQYARLFLKDIFPDVRKVLYLDADVVALGDVTTLFETVHLKLLRTILRRYLTSTLLFSISVILSKPFGRCWLLNRPSIVGFYLPTTPTGLMKQIGFFIIT